MTSSYVGKVILAMIATASLAAVLGVVVLTQGSKATDGGRGAPGEPELVILIARRQERMSEDQTDIPFRASAIGLYGRSKEGWRKLEGDLPVRSESTNRLPPRTPGELTQLQWGKEMVCGYASVPVGLYKLRVVPWKDGKNVSFEIADFASGVWSIMLDSPQELRNYRVRNSDSVASATVEVDDVPFRVSRLKQNTFLHPTYTRNWSFGDSHGCINLFHPKDSSPADAPDSDWSRFLGWLEKHGKVEEVAQRTALLIVDGQSDARFSEGLPPSLGPNLIVDTRGKPVP